MNIQVSDPLALLPAQNSVLGAPLTEDAANGSTDLATKQRSAVIGEVVPIVFCRQVSGVGGVLISPPATEARFEDAENGDITASYHLVLSEGQIDSIQVRDLFQGNCRLGSFTQTYGRRAGTFTRGNFIDNSPDLQAPQYCGTGGTYAGLSTMAFQVTIPAGFDYWDRQVHCFVRGGLHVNRLLDSVNGPSNNVVDLLLYLLQTTSRVSADQIDTAALTTAARFTDTNGFWYNGVLTDSSNLRDWMSAVLPYFLLRSTRIAGKEALRPLLPYTAATGQISTAPVTWKFTFTEEHILEEGFQIIYTPLADRKAFCTLMLWRQQSESDVGLIRSTEVRYVDTALDGPYEQHDLSAFCTTENHAVKVGAYILARRKHITHTLALTVRPDTFNATLVPGDLVRVRLVRSASSGAASIHNELYEVDRIGKNISGAVQLDLTHFPVDENLSSVVALEVAGATGNGYVMPTGKTGAGCDFNSAADTTIPPDTSTGPVDNFPDAYQGDVPSYTDKPWGSDVGPNSGFSGGGTGSIGGYSTGTTTTTTPTGATEPEIGVLPGGVTQSGSNLTYDPGCPNAYIEWYVVDDATGERTLITQGLAAQLAVTATATALGVSVLGIGRCPDGSTAQTGLFKPLLAEGFSAYWLPNAPKYRYAFINDARTYNGRPCTAIFEFVEGLSGRVIAATGSCFSVGSVIRAIPFPEGYATAVADGSTYTHWHNYYDGNIEMTLSQQLP